VKAMTLGMAMAWLAKVATLAKVAAELAMMELYLATRHLPHLLMKAQVMTAM
jgi:hypothetical protein